MGIADQDLALLLACAKSVVALKERMRASHWDKATHKSMELCGRTIGLIGWGTIDLRFAEMVDALGMRVLGVDPFARNLPSFVNQVDLQAIWREADMLSLHCLLTEDHRQLAECRHAASAA